MSRLLDKYPGTCKENPWRLWREHNALEVTEDLEEEELHTGKSGNDLETGPQDATTGSTSDYVRGYSPAFPLLLSPAIPKPHGSKIRIARRPSQTPMGLDRSAPRSSGRSGPSIVEAEGNGLGVGNIATPTLAYSFLPPRNVGTHGR
jgi:hypothetical protein